MQDRSPSNEDGACFDAWHERWRMRVQVLLLFVGTFAYLQAFPLFLGPPDEPHALHEAKRVLNGEVLYRDVFDLITPVWIYLMAGLFSQFGTSLATARATTALIHGGTVAFIFLASRRAGVRPTFATAASLGFLLLSVPIYPVASQHWLATFLSAVLLYLTLDFTHPPREAVLIGLSLGLLIGVHQSRGIVTGLGVAAVLAAIHLIERTARSPSDRSLQHLLRPLGQLAAGTLIMVIPMLAWVVARAGFEPVWQALVLQPLFSYAPHVRAPWGKAAGSFPALPIVLTYMPAIVVLLLGRLCVSRCRSADCDPVVVTLLVLGVFSIASIYYYPDAIHIAFVLPVFLVAYGDALERGAQRVRAHGSPHLATVGGLVLLTGIAVGLYSNLSYLRRVPSIRYESAFGPLDLPRRLIAYFEKLRVLLQDVPGRTLYCHPISGYTYLLAGARNPTRFEFLLPGSYSSRAQVDEVLQRLRSGDVPYVVFNPNIARREDPIAQFIREEYEPIADPDPLFRSIWKRRPSVAGDM